MCIFSRRVLSVSDTNIFARLSGQGTQYLVYSMKYAAGEPVAMILPLPVADPKKRLGIRFINFKPYADFFNDMEHGFPREYAEVTGSAAGARPAMMARPTIHVESVGDFIASYVPTLDDFDRVDPRFRLPRTVWNKIPAYADYGFAVFQLKKTAGEGGTARLSTRRSDGRIVVADEFEPPRSVHPMAFEFHTRLANTLYYPTVHIHDEQVHPSERFDHSLFFQDPRVHPKGRFPQVAGPMGSNAPRVPVGIGDFEENGRVFASNGPATGFVEWRKTQGAVDPNGFCYKVALNGELANKDALIRVG